VLDNFPAQSFAGHFAIGTTTELCGYDPWKGWPANQGSHGSFHIKDWVKGEPHPPASPVTATAADPRDRGGGGGHKYDGFATLRAAQPGRRAPPAAHGTGVFPKAALRSRHVDRSRRAVPMNGKLHTFHCCASRRRRAARRPDAADPFLPLRMRAYQSPSDTAGVCNRRNQACGGNLLWARNPMPTSTALRCTLEDGPLVVEIHKGPESQYNTERNERRSGRKIALRCAVRAGDLPRGALVRAGACACHFSVSTRLAGSGRRSMWLS